jgi:hypothetical protein
MGNAVFPRWAGLVRVNAGSGGAMVLFRGLGWLMLALAVAAVVHDGLAWWSEGAFRLLPLGELWSRLDFRSLHGLQTAIEFHFSSRLWAWVLAPFLKMPALPAFLVVGFFCLWFGGRPVGGRPELNFIGARPPRRRRSRGGLS